MLQNHLDNVVFVGGSLIGEVAVDINALCKGGFGLGMETGAVEGRHCSVF